MNISITRIANGQLLVQVAVHEQITLLDFMTQNGLTWSNQYFGWLANDNATVNLMDLYGVVETMYFRRPQFGVVEPVVPVARAVVPVATAVPVTDSQRSLEIPELIPMEDNSDTSSESEYLPPSESSSDSEDDVDSTVDVLENIVVPVASSSVKRPKREYFYYKKGILIPAPQTDVIEEREILEPELGGFYNRTLKGYICHLHDEERIKGYGYKCMGTMERIL